MHKINRYVFTTVFNAIALTLVVFLSLFFIFTLIDQLDNLRDKYTFAEAFIFVALRMPNGLYIFMPFSCLIGCLAGLGSLASSSELVVVRAAGISTQRIVWMTLRPALVFMLLAVLVGEFISPYTEQLAINRKAIALSGSPKQSQQISWNHENNEFMHFNAVLPTGIIHGVSRYTFDDQRRLVSASFAREATYENDHWVEEDVSITHIADDSTSIEKIPTRRWDTELTPHLLNILVLDPKNLSIRNLYYYIHYLRDQNIANSDYSLSFWQKVLAPLAIASLVLIAISFIFGPLRSVTMGQRIFSGVLFGVAFEIAQRLFGPSSLVFGFPPLLAVLMPIVLCVAVGVYLLRRSR
jgi:lipopolysaccharide export system permease protein